MTMTTQDKAQLVRDYAAQTMGTEDMHRHPMCRLLLSTDGVQFVAETCGSHWLIDAIASHLGTKQQLRAEPFQVWKLHADKTDGAVLVCTNGNDDKPMARQVIPYSDFPRDLMPFRLYCEQGGDGFVLMLPEER